MPKIIKDLPLRLTEEARRQVLSSGYGALTIRNVAKHCGVGVGTVYNYYDSKDALVASFLLEDWKQCLNIIHDVSGQAVTPEPVLKAIYDQLTAFLSLHSAVFQDKAAAVAFSGSFSHYHSILRSQLADPLRKFCPDDFSADFIAEAMLTWTVSGKPFDAVCHLITKLF